MNRFSLGAVLSLTALLCAGPLYRRHLEERADRRVLVVVEWPEIAAIAARESAPDQDLIKTLRDHGVGGILFSPLTLSDRLTATALEGRRASFPTAAETAQVLAELRRRGAAGLDLDRGDPKALVRRDRSFFPIKDIETGFPTTVLEDAAATAVAPVLRLNQDPWLSCSSIRELFASRLLETSPVLMFNSDEMLGTTDAAGFWAHWLRHGPHWHAFFEFKPAKAAAQMAWAVPESTLRAHTIPTPELRDMTPAQESARWRRAIEERNVRLALIHAGPSDSVVRFLDRVDRLVLSLRATGWTTAIPRARLTWHKTSEREAFVRSIAAMLLAIVFPLGGLWAALALYKGGKQNPILAGGVSFLFLCFVVVVGGSAVAALAQTPETRIQVVAFRGIKACFLMSWLGAIFILYKRSELTELLEQAVRRWDVVVGFVVLGLIAYVMIRTGNASAGWKPAAEQGIRDQLERWLLVRPRFKEFGFGHPLLLAGLTLEALRSRVRTGWDGRPLIALGMVGQASIINTFCHLHSPLILAYGRTLNGIVLGGLAGLGLSLLLVRWPAGRRSL